MNIREWMDSRVVPAEKMRYMTGGRDFIDDAEIAEKLERNRSNDPGRIKGILDKSLSIETLSPDDTAVLLNVTDDGLLEEMRETAAKVKRKVYDNRIVTFAPLYMGNYCVNNCSYCGFGTRNARMERKILSPAEIRGEVGTLAGAIGHKRLIVVYGEHPLTGAEYIHDSVKEIYSVKVPARKGYGQIRRCNVNAAPMPVDELKLLKEAGIGTYQVFQETYHHDTYSRVHPRGTIKADYAWRLYAAHRAMEAGLDDVGLGALFGLYDWKFEVMGLLYHSRELENTFGVGPHTISFPRIEEADASPITRKVPYAVSDDDFMRLVTVLRLSVPHTGMILTARENAGIRRKIIPLGCTQTDASTRIGVGGYGAKEEGQDMSDQQFTLGDTRSLDEVVRELADMGYITSFCTAGYRCGRTGGCIMELLKSGQEGRFCKLNAVLTFREWLDDFASEGTRAAGEKIIRKELDEIASRMPETVPILTEYYKRVENGERDIYF
ncbi:MAG: [FeFe] hydrogenase H-cluster radical SAM maturase HydG [Candidatus Omnitrophica bacterium]|nr:[FeFe] hydrogenase H-cluster radical SAM maturase HydG [Candidatus Omnitrophota bacterium]MDD5487721.1 [FeFe] hydrogenase H-cluster radical SAM maturase HydG [Candidatus Omnitrophota bacterium]